MASYKVVVLQQNKRRDNSMPVCIRVTHKRISFFIKTPYFVFAKQLDKDGNIKDSFLRPKINLLDNAVISTLTELGLAVNKFTAKELKIFIEDKLNGDAPSKIHLDFFEFAEQYIERMKADGRDSARNYTATINNLMKFLGRGTNLDFNAITANFCYQYHQWMIAQKLGIRGQELYFGSIRKLLNAAIAKYNDYDKDITPITVDPFRRFKIPKTPNTSNAEHRALLAKTIRKIFAYQPSPKSQREILAKDIFMLSFCLCGMNAIDLYTCTSLKNNVLIYNRSKTKDRRADQAEMRITIPQEVRHIVSKYKGEKGLVFSFAQCYSTSNCFNAALSKGLKAICKKLDIDKFSFYSARHSWATIAINDLQLPSANVDECLAHVPVRKMLHKYVKRDWSRIDVTNRTVLDYIFKNANQNE
ncbi:MAG: site-specific integrase [Prevotellaceae bacterium]|jgi:integrase|nr:site-specific integrase [Prevotellaceae bacterium]